MKLYFVRHGEAHDLAPSDHERELTEQGKARVENAANVLKTIGISPSVIYSSPRIRAKQTAEIIARVLGLTVTFHDDVNFGFDVLHVDAFIQPLASKDEVMFVGHNPDMSQIVHKMTGASVSMKKGGVARIDLISTKARRGELVWLIAPKVFDALYSPLDVDDASDSDDSPTPLGRL
jgi:phosphohistidine phosphatase